MNLDLSLSFDGHRVRMTGTPERPLWVAKDVCRVLGLHGAGHVARDVPPPEQGFANLATPGGPQPYLCVTEGGLWRLISRSRKPSAARFQSWLFNEVLPSLRKHGCYPPPTTIQLGTREQQIASALLLAQEVISEKDARLAVVEPKAEVYDEVMSSEGTFSVAEAANILARPHRPMGEKRLFAFMRDHGICKADNAPYQEHIEAGRFVVLDKSWGNGDGERHAYSVTRVAQTGIEYLLRRLDAVSAQRSLLPGRAAEATP